MPGGPTPHSGRVAFSSSSSFSIYLDRNDFESHHFSVYVHVFSALIVIVAGAFVITIIYRLVPLFFVLHQEGGEEGAHVSWPQPPARLGSFGLGAAGVTENSSL